MVHTKTILILLLALLSVPSTIHADGGQRSNSCTFGYNNTFYILGGLFFNSTNFVSTPLPISKGATNLWTPLPDPPVWTTMTSDTINLPPQFDCSVNKDGKVFLFGNSVGYAVYDISKGSWSTTPPLFQSGLSITNLQKQYGVSSAVFPDQYTIAIFTSSPPTYMELNSQTMAIKGVAVPGFTANLHGYCMDVVPMDPPVPVVCGGASDPSTQLYSDGCWRFGLSNATPAIPFTSLPSGQDGCALVGFGSHFIVFPGYLSSYHQYMPIATAANPNMNLYDMNEGNWSTIPNIQGSNFIPLVPYVSAATMPGTGKAILFGGLNPAAWIMYELVGIFDLQTNLWINAVNPAANPFPSSSSSSGSDEGGGGKANVGAIAGGVAGGIVVLGALAGFFVYKKKKSQQQHARYSYSSFKSELETLTEPPNFVQQIAATQDKDRETRGPHTPMYPLYSYTPNNPHATPNIPHAMPSSPYATPNNYYTSTL